MDEPIELGKRTFEEKDYEILLLNALKSGIIPDQELIANIHVFMKRQTLSRLLQLHELYLKILDLPGCIVQCGVRWGGDLTTLSSLRTVLEPFNYSRRIIGFDTFEGLKGTGESDLGTEQVLDGQFSVTENYMGSLLSLLGGSEKVAPLPHIKKHSIVKGDASITVPKFLRDNAGEMISLLYLDMDIYKPTRDVLVACADRLVPGAVVVFDEYGASQFPGEAVAARELMKDLKLNAFHRSRLSTVTAYAIKS